MKISHIKVAAIATIAAGIMFAGAGVARASDTIDVKVPFAFMVGNAELPAGSYILTPQYADPDVFKIANASGQQFAFVMTSATSNQQPVDQPRLQFKKMGNEYVLASINSDDGRQLTVTDVPSRENHTRATGTR